MKFSSFHSLPRVGRIAAVLHLYYEDLWPELSETFGNISEPFDLFVSVPENTGEAVLQKISSAFPTARIMKFENRGRDVMPFMAMINAGLFHDYELVCKIHTKKSLEHERDGDEWRRSLVDGILGDPSRVRDILDAFDRYDNLGLVVADGQAYGSEVHHWSPCFEKLAILGQRINITAIPAAARFCAGTMFWTRASLLEQIADLNLTPEDFEPEPIGKDGHVVHAVERLFGLVAYAAGMEVCEYSALKTLSARQSSVEVSAKPGRLGVIARLLTAALLLPATALYHGKQFRWLAHIKKEGLLSVFTPVLQEPAEVEQRLMRHPRLVRGPTLVGLSLALRIYKNGSIVRSVADAWAMWREGGVQGLIACVRERGDIPLHVPAASNRILIAYSRIPKEDISGEDRMVATLLRNLCALGFDVVLLPHDMEPGAGHEAALAGTRVEVVNRNSGHDTPRAYLRKQGHSFSAFYLIGRDVAEDLLPTIRVVSPAVRVVFHMSGLNHPHKLQTTEQQGSEAAVRGALDIEFAIMRLADHVIVASRVEADIVKAKLPEIAVSVFPEPGFTASDGRNSRVAAGGDEAYRSTLLPVLNNARILPLDLFCAYCRETVSADLFPWTVDGEIDVSVVIPVYNQWALTRACLNSIAVTCRDPAIRLEVIIADDCSTDETVDAAKAFPGIRVVRTESNAGFLRNCNNAVRHARGRHVLLLNNDTVVLPGWLSSLYRMMESDAGIAIAGSKLLYPDGIVQEAGAVLFSDGTAHNLGRGMARFAPEVSYAREVDYISGASILVRKTFWDSVGGFDERYKNAYCEDSDLAMAARAAGMRVVYQPESEVVHFEHQSYNEQVTAGHKALQDHNIALLREKWHDVFQKEHVSAGRWQLAAERAERYLAHKGAERRKAGHFNILYFSPFPSHPSSHGNRSTINQFASYFKELGHSVHFVLLQGSDYTDKDAADMRNAWNSLDIVSFNDNLPIIELGIPFDGWYREHIGPKIRALCEQYDIDIVFCSYVFQSKLLDFVPGHALKVIDTHDKMGDRYKMLREKGQPLEFFSCPPAEEGRYLQRADLVIARREEEARYFDAVSGMGNAITIPHVEKPKFLKRDFVRLHKIGIVASANRINLAVVQEFIEAMDRHLAGTACPFEIRVVGQVRDMVEGLPKSHAAVFRKSWVQMLGFVEDIGAFYADVDLVVSPITMGTGINVKTVQAMAYGMPLVTTAWGVKGIETGNPWQRYETMEALVAGLFELAQKPEELQKLADVSRVTYRQFYDKSMAAFAVMFSHPKLTGQSSKTEKAGDSKEC